MKIYLPRFGKISVWFWSLWINPCQCHIRNRGDRGGGTRWTSMSSNPFYNFLLSEVQCWRSMEGHYLVILRFHNEGSDYGCSMEIQVSKCWSCSWQPGNFIWFSRMYECEKGWVKHVLQWWVFGEGYGCVTFGQLWRVLHDSSNCLSFTS